MTQVPIQRAVYADKPFKAMRLWLGVDPGVNGGLAFIDLYGRIELYPWKDKVEYINLMSKFVERAKAEKVPLVAIIEKVGGFVGRPQSGAMMFKFGHNAGFEEGVLCALEIPFEIVSPVRWEKDMRCEKGANQAEHKRLMKEQAARLFPKAKGMTLKTCDAALLAEWGRRFCKL